MPVLDDLVEAAVEMAVTLEEEFGKEAVYTKRGADIRNPDGTITSGDVDIPVIVWQAPLTQQDMARKAVAEDEARYRNWFVRKAVVGEGLANEDVLTIGTSIWEVLDPVPDQLDILYTLHTRYQGEVEP